RPRPPSPQATRGRRRPGGDVPRARNPHAPPHPPARKGLRSSSRTYKTGSHHLFRGVPARETSPKGPSAPERYPLRSHGCGAGPGGDVSRALPPTHTLKNKRPEQRPTENETQKQKEKKQKKKQKKKSPPQTRTGLMDATGGRLRPSALRTTRQQEQPPPPQRLQPPPPHPQRPFLPRPSPQQQPSPQLPPSPSPSCAPSASSPGTTHEPSAGNRRPPCPSPPARTSP